MIREGSRVRVMECDDGAEEAGAGLVATGLKDLARDLVEQETREGEAS